MNGNEKKTDPSQAQGSEHSEWSAIHEQEARPESVVATRDHETIRTWAQAHQAEPATGEATSSGDATIDVHDGGAGVRFNFPAASRFRPIAWDEWFEHFDRHGLLFVYDSAPPPKFTSTFTRQPGSFYRVVRPQDWKGPIR